MSELIEFENADSDVFKYALKRKELELLQKKKRLVEDNGIYFYRPHPKQEGFHSAAAYKRRMMRAGNRFGKSQMGVAEDIAFALGFRPWIPEGNPLRTLGIKPPPSKGLVVTTNWKKIEEVFTSLRGEKGKIWRYLPKSAYKSHKKNAEAVVQIELNNGSVIDFYCISAWENDPQSAESTDYDWYHFDEPLPEQMYKALVRGGVDRGASEWFTLTPLSEPWIQDLFFPSGRDQTQTSVLEANTNRPIIWADTGSMHDNPYLSDEGKRDYLATLSDDERQCRELGIPLYLSGLVYKEFEPKRHILQNIPHGWADYDKPPSNYTVMVGIDPHPQTPHAVLFIAVSPQEQIFVFDEVFIHCDTKSLALDHVLPRTKRFEVVSRYEMDPLGFIVHPVNMTTMASDFAQWMQVPVEKATKAKEHGIMRVKQELKRHDRIYVSPVCRRFIYEINRYCWDEKENKPVDKDDHMMECFYRLLLSNPIYIDTADWKHDQVVYKKPDLSLKAELNALKDYPEDSEAEFSDEAFYARLAERRQLQKERKNRYVRR